MNGLTSALARSPLHRHLAGTSGSARSLNIDMFALTAQARTAQNARSAGAQAPGVATSGSAETQTSVAANSGLKEIKATYE